MWALAAVGVLGAWWIYGIDLERRAAVRLRLGPVNQIVRHKFFVDEIYATVIVAPLRVARVVPRRRRRPPRDRRRRERPRRRSSSRRAGVVRRAAVRASCATTRSASSAARRCSSSYVVRRGRGAPMSVTVPAGSRCCCSSRSRGRSSSRFAPRNDELLQAPRARRLVRDVRRVARRLRAVSSQATPGSSSSSA